MAHRGANATNVGQSSVDRVQQHLRAMAVAYAFKPGERINEGVLAQSLGVSRTPVREALNRLCVEGLLEVRAGRGFFCRGLNAKDIFDLYQLRAAIESAGVRLTVERIDSDAIRRLEAFLRETGPEVGDRSTAELVRLDEEFHERLMEMSGNAEMLRVLKNVNDRIHFVRWIHMDDHDRPMTQREHRQILRALRKRDAAAAVAILAKHIDRRLGEITAAIREGYSRIYMGETVVAAE